MRHDAPFVVKRFAPMIGRPKGARRIAVEGNAYTLPEALELAAAPRRRRLALEGIRQREGEGARPWLSTSILELERTATWIERREARATTTTTTRARQGGGG